jgi:hypothetical protein
LSTVLAICKLSFQLGNLNLVPYAACTHLFHPSWGANYLFSEANAFTASGWHTRNHLWLSNPPSQASRIRRFGRERYPLPERSASTNCGSVNSASDSGDVSLKDMIRTGDIAKSATIAQVNLDDRIRVPDESATTLGYGNDAV